MGVADSGGAEPALDQGGDPLADLRLRTSMKSKGFRRWGERWDSNPRRPGSQPGALPAELRPPRFRPTGQPAPRPGQPAMIPDIPRSETESALEGSVLICRTLPVGARHCGRPVGGLCHVRLYPQYFLAAVTALLRWTVTPVARNGRLQRRLCGTCDTWRARQDSNLQPSA